MKKIILTAVLLATSVGIASAAGIDVIPALPIGNELGNMQNTSSQIRLMEQQKFRQEEYNDYNDNLQEVKAQRARQYQQYQEQKKRLYSPSQNIDFVNENGRIILKSID